MIRITALFVSALALSVCAAPGFAQPEPHQIAVRYADLDISRPAGAEVLIDRIRLAARSVCGTQADLRDIARFRTQAACQHEAMETAIRSVNSPLVAKLYGKPQLYAGQARFDMAAK